MSQSESIPGKYTSWPFRSELNAEHDEEDFVPIPTVNAFIYGLVSLKNCRFRKNLAFDPS